MREGANKQRLPAWLRTGPAKCACEVRLAPWGTDGSTAHAQPANFQNLQWGSNSLSLRTSYLSGVAAGVPAACADPAWRSPP